jgi:hypothetical protein
MILFHPELQIAKGDFGTVPTISLSWEIMQAKMARYASEI